ncbi:MAG: DMT family transporter, partial [Gammaproteobacteria bacterium]|nr:DMT family transporter [Gammaproteobacteria bacterium]
MSDIRFRLSPGAAYIALTATMLCLALNHVVSRAVHETVPPVGLSFWRWVLASLLMLPFIWRNLPATMPIFKRDWKLFTILGALMVGCTTLFVVTLQFTQAINISLVGSLQPAITVLLTWALLQHRLSSVQLLGVACGFLGVITMLAQGSWQVFTTLSFNLADTTALLAVAGLALYT